MESALHLFSASRHIERVADHATNIAEDVVYLVEGEMHPSPDSPQRTQAAHDKFRGSSSLSRLPNRGHSLPERYKKPVFRLFG
ncbi:MAG: PhoU domain-containing protein [Planctomycetaceae bacterium]